MADCVREITMLAPRVRSARVQAALRRAGARVTQLASSRQSLCEDASSTSPDRAIGPIR